MSRTKITKQQLREERDAYRDALAKLCEAYSALIVEKLPKEVLERRSIGLRFGKLEDDKAGWQVSVLVDSVEDPTLTHFLAANLHCLVATADAMHRQETGEPLFRRVD
jgi:hypothetical protein